MVEIPTEAPRKPTKVGVFASVNGRVQHVKNAVDDLKKAPVLSMLIAVLMFVMVFLANQLVSLMYDTYKPAMLKSEAEVLSDNLLKKSEGIEQRVNEISELIRAAKSGETLDADILQQKMAELLTGINAIKPDLSEMSSLRRDLFLVAARQKSHDIETAGLSPIPDVTLKMNDGATICKGRYSLATSHNGNPNTTSPKVGLTSPSGENVIVANMSTGAALVIDDTLGRISVSLMRSEEVGGEMVYGFNFSCPS